MSKQFVKVILVPNPQGASGFENRTVTINVSAIWEISMKRQNDYVIELEPTLFAILQKKYFGSNTTVKEVMITSNEVKPLLSEDV